MFLPYLFYKATQQDKSPPLDKDQTADDPPTKLTAMQQRILAQSQQRPDERGLTQDLNQDIER